MSADRRRIKVRLALAWVFSWPAMAWGAEPLPPRVSVALPACPSLPFERAALLELLSVELRSDGIERVAEGSLDAVATLRIEQPDCGKAQILLLIEDKSTGKTAGRGVDLGAVDASARARFLALSGAELLRASWLELLTLRPSAEDPLTKAVRSRVRSFLPPLEAPVHPPSVPPPAPSPPAAPPPAAPASPARRVAVQAGLLGRGYLSSQGGLLGGLLGAQIPWGEHLSWRIDARAGRGEAFDPLGRITLLQLGGTAAILAETSANSLRFGLGPQVELGVGRASGEAASEQTRASSGTRAVASVAAVGILSGDLSDRMEALGSFEVGTTLLGLEAQADGRHVAGLRGVFLGVTLGVGWPR